MQLFLDILLNIIFPVFLLMGMGIILHRIFTFDLRTLSKITMYYLLPVVGFVNIYESDLNGKIFLQVIVFQLGFSLVLMFLAGSFSRLTKMEKKTKANFKNSIVLMNSGNYGIPVSQFVFSAQPIGMSIQIIVMIVQNFLTNTYGLMNVISVTHSGWKVLKEFLKLPMIYALVLGLLFQYFQVTIPSFVWNPVLQISDSFLSIALLALGAQVAYIPLKRIDFVLVASTIGRLIVSPLIALVLLLLFGMGGTVAKALFIASSFPASRNSAQLALEFDVDPEHAGQTVLVTTILSAITVTFVVYLADLIF